MANSITTGEPPSTGSLDGSTPDEKYQHQPSSTSSSSPPFETTSSALRADNAEKEDDAPTPPRNRFTHLSSLSAILAATFLFALDNTIVAVVQPRLIQEFGQIQKLPWISVGYQLGSASVNLLWGRLFHHFDHKRVFLAGLLLFEVGSALCGAAPSLDALIVGRIICGIGGNGIYNGTMNIISNLTTIQERPVYMAYFGVIWGTGTVLGPIIGGALTISSRTGWRWCFYLNLCVAALFAPIYLFVLPSFHPQTGKTVLERVKKIDYVGTVLFAGGSVLGVMGLSFGGGQFAWSSAATIVPLVLSVLLWTLFVIQQRFSLLVKPDNRLFPVYLVTWENSIFFAQIASANASQLVPIYYVPLFFQFVHGDSALLAGVRALPLMCFGIFFVLLNGALMAKTGYYTPWFLGGSAFVVVGAALMSTVSASTAYSTIYGFNILLAIGVGSYTQASYAVMQAKHSVQESPNVVAFLVCAQKFGLTLSFSVANSIFINTAANRIAKILPNAPRGQVQAAIAGGTSSLFSGLALGQRRSVLAAVARSFDDVYYQVLAGSALSLILSLFMKRERLFGPTSARSS